MFTFLGNSVNDDDDEHLSNARCLPYGYFYNDDVVFEQLQMISSSSLPSSTNSSPVLNGSDLFGSTKLEENNCISDDIFAFPNEFSNSMLSSGQNPTRPSTSPFVASSTDSKSQFVNCDNFYDGTSNVTMQNNDHNIYAKSNFVAPQMNENFNSDFSIDAKPTNECLFDISGSFIEDASEMFNFDSNWNASAFDNEQFYNKKTNSPMLNKASQGPTLAELNNKEEEDDMLIWSNSDHDGFNSFTVPQHGSMLNSGNVVDLNGQQQQNLISSTSSTPKTVSNISTKCLNNEWMPTSSSNELITTATLFSTQNNNSVQQNLPEEIVVPDVIDDTSREIETILQQPNFVSQKSSINSNNTNQFYLASPPQISSSLPMQNSKQQLLQKLQIKKPSTVSPGTKPPSVLSQLLSMQTNNQSSSWNSLPNSMQLVKNALINQNATNTQTANNMPLHKSLSTSKQSMDYLLISGSKVTSSLNPLLSSAAINSSNAFFNNNRIRNNSMSTEYSVSSHDEGFASQPDEESEESDDNSEDMQTIYEVNDISDHIASSNFPNSSEILTSGDVSLNLDTLAQNAISDLDLLSTIKTEEVQSGWNQSQEVVQQNMIQIKSEPIETSHATSQKGSNNSAIDENEEESEEEDDDDDESFYGNYEPSDLLNATTSDDVNNKWSLNMGRSRKGSEKRFFWQYNVQSKGPKGPRLGSSNSFDDDGDPHVFNEIADPVFSPDCQVEGVKHSGKARRGDGNDLTPNPKKLLMIGLELKKLSKIINDLIPVYEVPMVARNNSRKEKNKLASRACRLKKKAQHEANKIKLHGLHCEHGKTLNKIKELSKLINIALRLKKENKPLTIPIDGFTYDLSLPQGVNSLLDEIDNRNKLKIPVAGHTAEFVNHVLDNVSAGVHNGGIDNI